MTVSASTNRIDYVGTGTDTYPYPFRIFADTDLKVYVDNFLQTLTTDYTVTGAGDDAGGNVVFVASVSGLAIAIVREVSATQGVDYVANDAFPAETHEAALDKLTMISQQNAERIARAPKLAVSSTESEVSLDNLAGNAGKFAQANPTEDGIVWTDSDPAIVAALDDLLTIEDSRTNSVAIIATHTATTSGTPAAGIGTGQKYQAESQDEEPSDVGQDQFAFSDVGAGTEDSYKEILLRVAGAALTAVYRWAATTAFRAIFTHANTADRTYTLPDETGSLLVRRPTALVAGDFALSAGWGSTATVTSVSGTDTAWRITVTSQGSGIGASPTVTHTFKDGAYANVPYCNSKQAGGTGGPVLMTEVPTTTQNVITAVGTPTTGQTFVIQGLVIGI